MRGRNVRDRESGMTVGEKTSVNVVFDVFKDVVTAVPVEVEVCRDWAKGSATWTRDIKRAVEGKKKAYKKCCKKMRLGKLERQG